MKTLEALCEMYGIIGLVYYEESERFICINNKILYNKDTDTITLLGQSAIIADQLKAKN